MEKFYFWGIKSNAMDDKDFQLLMDLFERLAKEAKTLTKEQALKNLFEAGIIDKNGRHTKPYRNIAKFIKPIK
jgi:hypothetical protein